LKILGNWVIQGRNAQTEPDPRDLMRPFPAEPMRMWPISTRVNKQDNDDPSIVEPIELGSRYCLCLV